MDNIEFSELLATTYGVKTIAKMLCERSTKLSEDLITILNKPDYKDDDCVCLCDDLAEMLTLTEFMAHVIDKFNYVDRLSELLKMVYYAQSKYIRGDTNGDSNDTARNNAETDNFDG